jgi:hypothetical protein
MDGFYAIRNKFHPLFLLFLRIGEGLGEGGTGITLFHFAQHHLTTAYSPVVTTCSTRYDV